MECLCILSNEDPTCIVDLEVIKIRMNVPSETMQMCENFRAELLERDVCCIWTGLDAALGNGSHIIPFKRGSEVCDTKCVILYSHHFAILVVSANHRKSSDP